MLTRSEVARRLGKSVATVRRIEGVLLAPRRDRHGVYRFDAADVDDLVRDIARGDVSLWQELNDAANGSKPAVRTPDIESADAIAQAQLERTTVQLTELEREHRELLSFTQHLANLFVERSSARQLDALPEVVLATLIALSED